MQLIARKNFQAAFNGLTKEMATWIKLSEIKKKNPVITEIQLVQKVACLRLHNRLIQTIKINFADEISVI